MRMDSLDRSYLAFRSDGILYLLPLDEVERIVGRKSGNRRYVR